MSQENETSVTERLRAGQQAFNSGDFERAFAALAPDVQWYTGAWVLDADVLRGRAEVIAYYSRLQETAGDWQVEIQEVLDAGRARFVVHQHGRYEGRTSRIKGALDFFQVWQLGADGLVTQVREYETRAAALKAVGLEE